MSGAHPSADGDPTGAPSWHHGSLPDPQWPAPDPDARRGTGLGPSSATPSPSSSSTPSPRRRRLMVIGIPLLAVALVLGVVGALGGFATRTDRLITIPVGLPISTGPMEYSFTRATVVAKESLGKPVHEVIVYGLARTTEDESMAPRSSQFAGRDDVDRTVADPEIVRVGTASQYATGSTLTPGLPPVEFRVEFRFADTWTPTRTFRIGVSDLTYVKYFFGGEDPHWEPDSSKVFQVKVPMETLPAER